jgi:hypothetical protein
MKTFINYRIAATLQLLVFFFIAVLALHPNTFMQPPPPAEPWPEFFMMPVRSAVGRSAVGRGEECGVEGSGVEESGVEPGSEDQWVEGRRVG